MSEFVQIPLRDLVDIQSGFASGKRDEAGIAQIRMNNVTTEGSLDFSSIRRVPKDAVKKLDKFLLKSGDVLFNSTNSPKLVGKTALFVKQSEPFVFSNHFFRLVVDSNRLHSRFLARWLTRQQQKGVFELLCTKWVNQAAVRRDDLLALKIPLPPLAEQKRIAEILDQADELRQKRRKALARLDDLLQSVFLEMFGDPVTNPMGWEVRKLGDVVNFTTGKLDSNAAVEDGEYPFFTCAREIYAIDKFSFDTEALLLAGNNASADYWVKHYKGKFNAYQRTYVITLKLPEVSYKYMRLALEAKLSDLKRLSKGTNTRYLTLTILKPIKIQIPSVEVMQKFDAIHDELFVQREKMEQDLEKLDTLFASLQQRAFRGELLLGNRMLEKLVKLEADIRYQEPATSEEPEFRYQSGNIPILISAPHGAAHTRKKNGKDEYKEEDEYTVAFARFITEETGAYCIYARRKSETDPNAAEDAPYKDKVKEICTENGVKFLIDLHGMATRREAGIALGTRKGQSCTKEQQDLVIGIFEEFGFEENNQNELLNLWVNHKLFSGMGSAGREPMVQFVSEKLKIPAVQIEINGNNRIVQRKEDASMEDKSFQGDREMIEKTIKALIALVNTLNQSFQDEN